MSQNLPPEEIIRRAMQDPTARLRRQHELAVRLGVFTLQRSPSISDILQEACSVVASGVGSRFAKVLQYMPDSQEFLLVNGVGWNESDIGSVSMGADDASPAGYAYRSGQPVISNHLGNEQRFRTPELLRRYGVQRAINVPIRGVVSTFGVLEADSTSEENFLESDVPFLEAVANVISMALEREVATQQQQETELFSTAVLNASPDCVKVLTPDGELEFMNENGLCLMEIDDLKPLVGRPWGVLWPIEERSRIDRAVSDARAGKASRFEAQCPTAKGNARWWDISVSPIKNSTGAVLRIISVSRDISEQHLQEQRLTQLAIDRAAEANLSILMMKEVHHRVRNNLQLIHTLLQLQGNLAGNDTVKDQLNIAANRVMTIASVHERLFQNNGAEAADASHYLAGLLDDLQKGFDDRTIALDAVSVELSDTRLAPLGLIACELVTNALKYGKGNISVKLTPDSDALMLSVEDEGTGFPATFPKPQGTGLGMRLVRSYSGFGPAAIEVDRTVPHSKIVVRFKR